MADVEKNEPTAVATATNVTSVPIQDQEKQGAKCCGCCCDYRRAVVIVDSIYLAFSILWIIIAAAWASVIIGVELDDDTNDELFDDVQKAARNNIIFSVISILCFIIAIIGAKQFNVYMVGLNILWMVIGFIINIAGSIKIRKQIEEDYVGDDLQLRSPVGTFIIQAVILGLVIYPHAGFIHEVKAGIMTRETYPREEFSCCCVKK